MSDHENEHEGGEGGKHEGGFLHNLLTGIGISDGTLGVAEGVAGEALEHGAPGIGAFVGPFGMLAGGAELGMGANEVSKGEYGQGGLTMARGLASIVGGGASTLGALSGALEGEAVLGVSSGLGAPAAAGLGEIGSLFTVEAGAAGAGAVAAGPVAAVAGAAGLGLATGAGMAAASDSDATRTGLWGTDPDTGKAYSAMDAASNWGTNYDRDNGVRPGDWSFGGAARAAVGGIGAGFAGTAQAGYNASGLGGLVDSGIAGVSNWFGGADQAIRTGQM